MEGPRFTGAFQVSADEFGFLTDVKGMNGQTPADIPRVKGKPDGVFLFLDVAEETLGGDAHLLGTLKGLRMTFAIRRVLEGKEHAGELEGYDVQRII